MILKYFIAVIIVSALIIILPTFLDERDFIFINKINEPISTSTEIILDINKKEEIKAGGYVQGKVAAKTKQNILLDVPFTSQAPFGDWSDPRQQDGCEETAVIMAMYWTKNKSLISQEALDEILALSKWQTENYSEYRDTSAFDTAERLFGEYFEYRNFEVIYDFSAEDIIAELQQGNLIITPMNGQKLVNPYFTPPGSERHMVVIRGYDFSTKEFITNDPGTKRGEAYRYKQDAFMSAIRDYPTGYHEDINKIIKAMIIIRK